jgi:Tol biopolymer transport system component/DNA-binding winged helix-turn-helix (wHTH) protein
MALHMPDVTERFFRFPPFQFDLEDHILLFENRPVPLPTRAAEILAYLIENRHRLVTREELRTKFWGELNVAENTIDRQISEVRRALKTCPNGERYLATKSKKGWRFIADAPVGPVTPVAGDSDQVHAALNAAQHELTELRVTAGLTKRWTLRWVIAGSLALIGAVTLFSIIDAPRLHPRVMSVVQLTDGGSPKEGPLLLGGQRLFFSEPVGNTHEAFSLPISGGEPVPLNIPLPYMTLQDISRDGTKLLVLSYNEGTPSLWSYSVASKSLVRVGAGFVGGAWASDGTLAAIAPAKPRGDHYSVAILGPTAQVKAEFPGEIEDLRWSPDGRKLRFSVLEQRSDSSAVWEMERNGSAKRLDSLSDGERFAEQGSWSSDGRRFVYGAGNEHRDVLILPGNFLASLLDTQKPYRLTNGGPGSWHWPVFSRDGSTIFATSRSLRSELVRFDPASNLWLPKWRGAPAFELDYSRDGKWVVYTNVADHTLWKSRQDGSMQMELTDAQIEAHQAHWSPDGSRIAFMGKNHSGKWRVMLVSRNGGKSEELIPSGENQGVPTWSPDGNQIIFGDRLGRRTRAEMSIHLLDLRSLPIWKVPKGSGVRGGHRMGCLWRRSPPTLMLWASCRLANRALWSLRGCCS